MNTLHEFLDYIALNFGDSEAYLWLDGEQIVSKSFNELRDDGTCMAGMLREKYGSDRKIALIGDMSYAWIAVYYGIMTGSNISVPLDTKLSLPEIADRLNFADVSVVFLSKKYAALRDGIISSCPQVETVLFMEDSLADVAEFPLISLPPVDPDALSSLMFTSGTTGDGLKAAMITQRAILADVTGPVPLCVPGDRLLSVLPIHHCFEIFVGQMKYLYLGGAICVNDSMANLVKNMNRFGITIVVAVPALANMLASMIGQGLKSRSVEEIKAMLGGKLRRITIGGASASIEVIETLAKAGITVFVGYGLTETAGGCLANCDASIRPREAGAPYVEGMEMKLVDDELCLRGPMVMQGYYKSPDLTASVLKDGWFHTGDLAEITDENYVIIKGRKDNMIKTPNGEKVYPEAWENRLLNIPGVTSAMVANIHDHLTAILFLKDDSPELREAIIKTVDQINGSLPNYEKIPDVRFREKPFPMTTSLKIKRGLVLEEIKASEITATAFAAPENENQKRIMECVLQVLPGKKSIGIDDNLFDCGLDSLSAIHLGILLDRDPAEIYVCRTVRALSENSSGNETEIRGEKISDINRYITMDPSGSKPLEDPILLTGANGYLGSHLLAELLRNGYRVICLVRNPASLEKARAHFGFPRNDPRMETVIGDITETCFGLRTEQYQEICERVRSVIHTAALVNHVGSESDSYRVNVGGTEEVLRFCKESGAALFHISSYAVSGFGTDEVLNEDILDIGQEIRFNPYIQTKYQAEELVLRAREQGVASTIFRLGNLAPRLSDGKFQINADANGMAAQLRAFRTLGIYPESMSKVPYDITAVDEAAHAILLLAENDGTGHIWHIINPYVRDLAHLTGAEKVTDAEFLEKLAEHTADRDTAIMSVYYRMRQQGFNTNFDSAKTQSELSRLGFRWTE